MSVIFAFYVSWTFWGGKCLNKKIFSHFFLEEETFPICGKFFPAGLPNMQSMWLETFSHEMFFFEKTGCFYKCFQKLSGRLLNFCPIFWQLCQTCIPRVRGKIPRKNFFYKKNHLCFQILIHKILILRNNSACS